LTHNNQITANISPSLQHSRNAQRTAFDTRQKLTSTSGTNISYDQELLNRYAKERVSSLLTFPIMMSVIALFTSVWVSLSLTFIFATIVILANTIVVYISSKYQKIDKSRINIRNWTNRFIIAEIFYGISWSTLALFIYLGQGQNLTVIMFAIFLVGIATNAISTRHLPNATLASTMPITITVTASLILSGSMLNYTLAIIALGSEIFFLYFARQLHHSEITTLRHRAEKDSLIYDLQEAQNMSEEARKQAEQSNIAKSSFLATMSHELRTPLNAIIGFSEVLKTELLGPHQIPQYKEYAADICSSGEHLLTLINELLDLSRIEAGKYELNESTISLIDITQDCHRMLKIKADAKTINFIFSFEPRLALIWGDERAVRQVVLNLLSNAIKFTPQSGKIEVVVRRSNDGGQLISVKDNGPGIPQDEIKTVLSSFGQGSLAHKTAEAGAGLGLPIVQNIMQMHQGRFDLFSKLRFGTETIATFPRARNMDAKAAIREKDNKLDTLYKTG
jgi:two-component system cell cycle sensor histidine kinase PleC